MTASETEIRELYDRHPVLGPIWFFSGICAFGFWVILPLDWITNGTLQESTSSPRIDNERDMLGPKGEEWNNWHTSNQRNANREIMWMICGWLGLPATFVNLWAAREMSRRDIAIGQADSFGVSKRGTQTSATSIADKSQEQITGQFLRDLEIKHQQERDSF